MQHVAIFGDLHGHLRLMWKLCSWWQKQHGIKLDLILQCGDFGYFPNVATLDKATKRYAERDPEELGFANYFMPPEPLLGEDPAIRTVLCGDPHDIATVTAPLYWCHGNHEDFGELEKVAGGENFQAVDIYGRCLAMQQGSVLGHAGMRIGAIGGGPEGEQQGEAHEMRRAHTDAARWNKFSKLVCANACDKLLEQMPIDILITHCGPRLETGGEMEFASQQLCDLIQLAQPAYHFFSHHRTPVPPGMLGTTRYFWLENVSFERLARGMYPFGRVNPGCMGILRWQDANVHEFTVVDEQWLHSLRWDNFAHW